MTGEPPGALLAGNQDSKAMTGDALKMRPCCPAIPRSVLKLFYVRSLPREYKRILVATRSEKDIRQLTGSRYSFHWVQLPWLWQIYGVVIIYLHCKRKGYVQWLLLHYGCGAGTWQQGMYCMLKPSCTFGGELLWLGIKPV